MRIPSGSSIHISIKRQGSVVGSLKDEDSRRWRGVARALDQVLACLTHRDARPAGGRTDVGDRREQGVLPEFVGLPPGDLIQQVRLGPAVDGCRGQRRAHRILAVLF
jgi:hypothetical protein